MLPAGEYPMSFTAAGLPRAQAAAQSRATAGGVWDGGEQVSVQVGDEVRTYVAADAAGTLGPLAAADAFYWSSTGETRTVTAWAPASAARPADGDLCVEADQNAVGTDGVSGYQRSDHLAAAPVTVAYPVAANLVFTHRMARVHVTLACGEGVAQSLIEDAELRLCNLTGVGAPGTAGEIAAYHAPESPDRWALVVPQTPATDKILLRITLTSGETFEFRPTEAVRYQPGHTYGYTATLTREGRMLLTISDDPAWTEVPDWGQQDMVFFTADDLKIGDYYYDDGSWSDGGVRVGGHPDLYLDSKYYYRPAPVLTNPVTKKRRNLIGIVFQTDSRRIGKSVKELFVRNGWELHGLAIAIANAPGEVTWGPDADEKLMDCRTISQNYDDLDGYGNCECIHAARGGFDAYPAFRAAGNYGNEVPAPAKTTGWFLPSSGQWWDILCYMGGIGILCNKDIQTGNNDDYISDSGHAERNLNDWLAYLTGDENRVPLNGAEVFSDGDCFWSSSEYSAQQARIWEFDSGTNCDWNDKSSAARVRPVLAF